MNPEVLEEIDAHDRIINSPIMNRVVLEEIDAYNGTTSPTIIQNNHSFIKSKNNKNMIYYNKYLYVHDFGDLYYKCRKNNCKGRERCGLLYLNTKFKPTIIVNIYAPPRRNERLNFIDTVTTLIDSLPLRYNIIILGDLNLKIGKSVEYINTNTIGNATIQQTNNEDSKKLLDYCKNKNFKIENTFFLHREINAYTIVRANQKSQIDFIISNIHGWFDDVIVSTIIKLSDHRALVAKMTIKNIWGYREEIDPNMTRINFLKPLPNRKQIKVKSQEDIQHFDRILVRKRENFLNITSNGTVDICWNLFKKDITESYNMLPNINVYLRREWLSNETVGKISQLREGNNLNRELWKEIQKLLRSDRRKFVAKKAFEIEKDMNENRIYEVYNKLKYFCKPYSFKKLPSLVLANENVISDQDEQIALWLDHYMSVFDSRKAVCQINTNEHETPPPSGFSTEEIEKVIKKLRNNKAPGLDNITAEHLKTAPKTVSSFLLSLYNKIWDSGKTPVEWNKSYLCNFPK
ncbi:uncharacterized protein LOC135930613 [Gordionus sp. m RMFG-2023]|uniref:uncharacterized protein LOC135930613 n=1 Tax=Gordionus sp. m RMFG-2023 TaxID=3053472 RepID=UPI0031FC2ADF